MTDGSNNTLSSKSYCYDETAPTATSNVPSHVAASGSRGNLTTATTYTGASASQTTKMTYADTGPVLTSTDSINGETYFHYDGTYTYATSSSLPTPSSGVGMTLAAGYDTANTGLPLSSTDVNGNQTSYSGYDPLLRPTEVDYPASAGQTFGGKTVYRYTPTNITTDTYQTGSVYGENQVQLDGYGRPSRTATANGTLWYERDVCYDGNNNVAFSIYAFAGTGYNVAKNCSATGDASTYDSLGRTLSVTHADGSSAQYTYTGRATLTTLTTNGNVAKKIIQVDGLGRPATICELSAATLEGVAPAPCGTDIVGTGFLTTFSYGYASGNPQTTVTQGAQTRVFQTDWAGRPVSTTEPERGTTSYSYTSNATGLAVTRKRPKAN